MCQPFHRNRPLAGSLDAAGEEIIFSKHDEIKAYVNANKKDGTTLEKLKTLIMGWIEEQDRIADEMAQVHGETLVETAKS